MSIICHSTHQELICVDDGSSFTNMQCHADLTCGLAIAYRHVADMNDLTRVAPMWTIVTSRHVTHPRIDKCHKLGSARSIVNDDTCHSLGMTHGTLWHSHAALLAHDTKLDIIYATSIRITHVTQSRKLYSIRMLWCCSQAQNPSFYLWKPTFKLFLAISKKFYFSLWKFGFSKFILMSLYLSWVSHLNVIDFFRLFWILFRDRYLEWAFAHSSKSILLLVQCLSGLASTAQIDYDKRHWLLPLSNNLLHPNPMLIYAFFVSTKT